MLNFEVALFNVVSRLGERFREGRIEERLQTG